MTLLERLPAAQRDATGVPPRGRIRRTPSGRPAGEPSIERSRAAGLAEGVARVVARVDQDAPADDRAESPHGERGSVVRQGAAILEQRGEARHAPKAARVLALHGAAGQAIARGREGIPILAAGEIKPSNNGLDRFIDADRQPHRPWEDKTVPRFPQLIPQLMNGRKMLAVRPLSVRASEELHQPSTTARHGHVPRRRSQGA